MSDAQLEALVADGRLAEAILPVSSLLSLPRVVLDADAAWRFVHGSEQPVATDSVGRVTVFGVGAGELLGIGLVTDGQLRPDKVLPVT